VSGRDVLFQDLPRPAPFDASDVIRELGEGLVLRRATVADTEAVVAFNRAAHADPPDYRPEEHAAAWTRELIDGSHPSMRAEDFTIVEDVKEGRIASCLCLISHRVHYGGVELRCGQPELVGTHPEYRRRGLIAAQFEEIHRWAEARGQDLQLIDGIPWYYRQFGYEMALESGQGRVVYATDLDAGPVRDGVRVRRASEADAGFLAAVQQQGNQRHRLSCPRDEAFWRFELSGRGHGSMRFREFKIVESEPGEPLAALVHYPILGRGLLPVNLCEAREGASWPTLLPALFAELRQSGEAFAERDGGSFGGVSLFLGSEHPLYPVVGSRAARRLPSYAWYVRVPDLPGFVRKVAPALEAHLAASEGAGYTGRVDLSLYHSGLRLQIDAGRLTEVETWQPSTDRPGHVGLPDLTFLQLLFGFRSLPELRDFLPDCLVRHETVGAVVEALFPPQVSDLMLTD
jgi:GNAT superfamily N-acetyltransferase